MMRILGIDPGANTGCAIFEEGKLIELLTIKPWQLSDMITDQFGRVIFEDSRLQSHVWSSSPNKAVAIKMARNIGEVDAWCSLITALCEKVKVPAHGISPKNKGAKLAADPFERVTGWSSRSNAHERDAAMIAWPYRNAKN